MVLGSADLERPGVSPAPIPSDDLTALVRALLDGADSCSAQVAKVDYLSGEVASLNASVQELETKLAATQENLRSASGWAEILENESQENRDKMRLAEKNTLRVVLHMLLELIPIASRLRDQTGIISATAPNKVQDIQRIDYLGLYSNLLSSLFFIQLNLESLVALNDEQADYKLALMSISQLRASLKSRNGNDEWRIGELVAYLKDHPQAQSLVALLRNLLTLLDKVLRQGFPDSDPLLSLHSQTYAPFNR